MSENAHLEADWFSKPGDSLRSLMRRRSLAAEDISDHLNGGMATVRGLLEGSHGIDPKCAEALAAVVGGTPEFWLKRQANYEAALDRAVTAATREADDWLRQVPAPGPKQRGKLSESGVREEIRRRLTFFNVPTMHSWHERYGRLCLNTRFRRSTAFTPREAAVLLWLRRGEIEADLVSTRPWSAENLRARLGAIRKLSQINQPARFVPKLKALCAEAGVAVVIVRTPTGCHASGASRLITADKAMMLLSFRHRSDDQFWFTVFHEIGHLLLHGAKAFVDSDELSDDESEQEANNFARECIIPNSRLSEFKRLAASQDSIMRFSVSVGVSRGLIVGQMQHRGMIEHKSLNYLKKRWTWDEIELALV